MPTPAKTPSGHLHLFVSRGCESLQQSRGTADAEAGVSAAYLPAESFFRGRGNAGGFDVDFPHFGTAG